jgi:tetratricopeptide (TPR) repeat protein
MKMRSLAVLVLGTILSTAAQAAPSALLQLDRNSPRNVLSAAAGVLQQLYRGNSSEALAAADGLVKAYPKHPLSYLVRARVKREGLSDQDDDKKLVRKSAAPIYADIERAIGLSSEMIDSSEGAPRSYFYRGWAWMFKAQIDALSGSYWGAGRAAKKGKKDLERYLRLQPDDSDAKGIMGTFLYFADTLPTVIKFIKSLFLIPGGDREKGLEYLEYASTHGGLLTTDHKIILSAIYTIFEGRFEEGVKSFIELLDRYPSYLRLAEPLGLVAAFSPGNIRSFQKLEDRIIAHHMSKPGDQVDVLTLTRLRYHRSYSYILFNRPLKAAAEFEALAASKPERPDWLEPLSLLNLAVIYGNMGDAERAAVKLKAILEDERMKEFHDVAEEMLARMSDSPGTLDKMNPELMEAVYGRDFARARSMLENYRRKCGATIHYYFYSGEASLLEGDLEGAEKSYESALKADPPEFAQIYQMFAAVRLAELKGMHDDYDEAVDFLDKALHYYHKEFLIDMLIKGRKRYYSRLASRKLKVGPSLMISGMGGALPALP